MPMLLDMQAWDWVDAYVEHSYYRYCKHNLMPAGYIARDGNSCTV